MKIKWAITSLLIICINIIHVFGEEKLMEYKQGNFEEGFFLRKTIGEDDFTKNYLIIDKDGNIFNYQVDSTRFMKVDSKYGISTLLKLDLSRNPFIFSKDGENIYVDCYYGGFKAFKLDELFIKVSMREIINENLTDGKFYYNEEYNILFFADKNSNIHSIINPGMDDEQNKKNYRNPEQTKELFSKDSEYGKKGLVIDGKKLIISGSGFFWRNPNINGKQYACYDDSFSIWEGRSKIYGEDYSKKTDEEFESAAVHPSGDIYVLRMNWSTNTHNLYRIENTWDPEWREQWYKEHPEVKSK